MWARRLPDNVLAADPLGLSVCLVQGNLEMVQLLIGHGAEVRGRQAGSTCRHHNQLTTIQADERTVAVTSFAAVEAVDPPQALHAGKAMHALTSRPVCPPARSAAGI